MYQPLASLLLKPNPALVCAAHQRDIGWVLEIGETINTRLIARRTEFVWHIELLEAKHTLSSTCKLVKRCCAHTADADDNAIVDVAHVGNLRASRGTEHFEQQILRRRTLRPKLTTSALSFGP